MLEKDQDLIQHLSEENPRFRKLHEEHLLFEKQLQEYDDKLTSPMRKILNVRKFRS